MDLLIQFLLRASFGLALALATVSPRKVSSGYFRNHLYVVLGLSALAALLSRAAVPEAFPWAVAAAVLSYVGSVAWLYEKRRLGIALLVVVSIAALVGVFNSLPELSGLRCVQAVSSGLLLGFTMAAMLLGHWYLNAPGMELAPLRKLLVGVAASVVAHAIVCGIGLGMELTAHAMNQRDWLFLMLRWSFGLLGVLALAWLARQTLAIPNTQSATGILYVAVIGVFVGETMSLLLSAEAIYPV